MTSTPSTRRRLDGVAVGVSKNSIRSSRQRFLPRKDLVKNYRVHPTHWLFYAQVAVSHPSLFSVDVKTVDDGDMAGLLEFCLFGASVGVTDDNYEVPDDLVEDASRARNLSEKARLFDTGKE